MDKRVFGVETEYAVTGFAPDGSAVPAAISIEALRAAARRRLVHLPDRGSNGMYLRNGARFYIDCGAHPEYATPECSNPWDIVRHVRAGERIMEDLIANPGGYRRDIRMLAFRSNVDYADPPATWGCHESYMHAGLPPAMEENLVPHLVTRVIFTGAGGFDGSWPGIRFLLSPRQPFLSKPVSSDSTANRGIFHDKQEPLAGKGFQRLHVLSGESVCSDTAAFLKVGTTALVVAMIDAGVNPGRAVPLADPVAALRIVARDTRCAGALAMRGGGMMTALAVQRRYLQQAESYLRRSFMPEWAGEVCRLWRCTLGALENSPESMSKILDWPLKQALYAARAARRGIPWESLPVWNAALGLIQGPLRSPALCGRPLTPETILEARSAAGSLGTDADRTLSAGGLDWRGLGELLALRRELFEIDVRFGQLGPGGIFNSLDREGVLDHRIEGVGDPEAAAGEPPTDTRAKVRGQAVRELSRAAGTYICDWQAVFDLKRRRVLDLMHPLETGERWMAAENARELFPAHNAADADTLIAGLQRAHARRADL